MKRLDAVCRVCLFAFGANLLLFGVKLYIGLAANSISVFSDAVNNLFDALSGLASFAGLFALRRGADPSAAATLKKGEQLFSVLISAVLCGAGLYFAYSSLERLLYPAPVWYTPLRVYVLSGTAAAKLAMFFFYRAVNKKARSPVLRVMTLDCVLDFCITVVSALTLAVSGFGGFSVDALAGLAVSALIVVPAVKNLVSAAAGLVNYVPAAKRAALQRLLATDKIDAMYFFVTEDETLCFLSLSEPADLAARADGILRETGIRVIPLPEGKIER